MLDTLEFFSSLTPQEIQEVARIAKRAEYRRGEIIFQQGEISRDLYAIETGLVEISTKSVLQETKVLAQLKNGDLFGEMALFDPHSVRSATARALQNTVLIVIPGTEFEKLLKEKPTISFKLLGTLSKRLKEANQRAAGKSPTAPSGPGRIITVAGPRNGVGKTTFAVTMAQILDQEAGVRTLFLDLDLPFADGTFLLGVHSLRTITEFVAIARGEFPEFDSLKKHLTHVGTNLYCLPGPVNIIDGEKIDAKSLVTAIRLLQRFFEYIVIDTDARIDEIFLAALDLADRIYFLIDGQTPYGIKSSTRYFYGLNKLNLAESRITILVARAPQSADCKAISGLLRLPVQGQLPVIDGHQIQYGRGLLPDQASHPFCHTVRQVLREFFPIEFRSSHQQSFLSRLFSSDSSQAPTSTDRNPDEPAALGPTGSHEPRITFRNANFRALLRYIRTGLIAGQIEDARRAVLQLLEMSGTSAPVFQLYGEILMQEGKTSEAIEAFHKAVQLDPECHLALGYAAILSLDRPLFQQAVELLQKKIEQHPGWPDLRRDLGELYLRHDRPAEALPHLQEAIRINPRYEDARLRLAEALFQLGRGEEAIRELLAMTQKNAPAFYLLGKCFQSIDRFVEALESFRLVQRICPTYRDTNERIDELQDYFARLNNLISMHQKIRREHPNYLDVRLKLAQLLTSAGRRDEAETEYLEALTLKPDFEPAQEALQRLRTMPIYDFQALSGASSKEGRTCRGIVCPGLHIALHFGDQALDPVFQERFSKFLLSFRNIRNGRTWEFKIPATFSSTIDLSATALCPMAEDDVIQVKLINPQSSEVLFTDAYLLSNSGTSNCRLSIDFAPPLRKLIDQLPLIVPLRAFLVGIPRVAFTCRESHPLRDPVPVLVNPRNQVKAEGRIDPDHPEQYCFVLYTPNDQEDVVKLGDLLEVYYGATMDEQSLVMQIRVGPDDLISCSRFLAPEEVALPKPSLNRPPPTPPLAASEPSPSPNPSGEPQPAAPQADTPAIAAQVAPPPRPPATPSPKSPSTPKS